MTYAATIKVVRDGGWPVPADGMRHPWQETVAGSGLTLHAQLDLKVDLDALQAEFAALDAGLEQDQRTFTTEDGSWSAITLIGRTAAFGAGTPQPALPRMPAVSRLIAGAGWTAVNCHLMRLPPHGILPWHFEPQAAHLRETRLLVPLHAPAGAITLIGDEAAAYPEGVAWTGDFTFPHQVENRSDRQRIVLIIDVVTTPDLLRLLPPALTASVDLRARLADQAVQQLVQWRSQVPR